MCQDYLPRCTSQIFLPCKPNKSFWVYDKYASHLFWAGIVQYLLTCSTLISYGLVLYGIYWHILHSTHLLWAGIVWYLLKCTTLLISSGLVLYGIFWCTTLYSSLLGRYCTVFTDMYYTLLISSGLVLYSIYFSFPRRVMHVHSECHHFETCNFRPFNTRVTDAKTDKGTVDWTKGITESVQNWCS